HVVPPASAALGDLRLFVPQVAECDCFCRTRLLAGGDDLIAAQRTAFLVGCDTRCLDPLRAICTFFHDAAGSHGDVRIFYGLLSFGKMAVIVPIEPAHLVWTVTLARTRADAAVVDQLIDAFRRVHGGVHGAAHFTGSLLAIHARGRLKKAPGDFPDRRCSSGRRGATTSRVHERPDPSRRRARCSRHYRRKCMHYSRCTDPDRSPFPTRGLEYFRPTRCCSNRDRWSDEASVAASAGCQL